MNISRRRLLGGTASAALLSGSPALAQTIFLRGGGSGITPPPPSGPGPTLTYVNTSASPTPDDVPIQATMWFPPGAVPSGSIAVPFIGGAEQIYQADNRVYWDADDSLKGAVFRITRNTPIVGNGAAQITFVIRPGSYSNTSSVTASDFAAESDFKISVSGIHAHRIGVNYGPHESASRIWAIAVDGDQVTSMKVRHSATSTSVSATLQTAIPEVGADTGTFTLSTASGFSSGANTVVIGGEAFLVSSINTSTRVATYSARAQFGTSAIAHSAGATVYRALTTTGGVGTGAWVYAINGTGFVLSGGSGYAFTGPGSFDTTFNDIVSTIESGGNFANGVCIEQYAKGPVCDAYMVRSTVPGVPHFHVTFFVERWKKTNGSLLTYRACAWPGAGLFDTANTLTNYTYDLDWKNGDTVIRGASDGHTDYESILHFIVGSYRTLDQRSEHSAKMDWMSNDDAYKSIIQQRTPEECDYFKKTGMILPYVNDIPGRPVPTVQAAYAPGQTDAGILNYSLYTPLGNQGIRSALGSGGAGNQENPMQENDGNYWMSLRSGMTTEARTWLNNIRVSAANSPSIGGQGGGLFEPTTMHVPNVIPVTHLSLPGMTPTRHTVSVSSIPINGYAQPLICGGGIDGRESISTTYHQVMTSYGAYLIEGEQWQLKACTHQATTPLIGKGSGRRRATLGTTTYYGTDSQYPMNVRVPTWDNRTKIYATAINPKFWSDGAPNLTRTMIEYCVKSHYDYLLALIPFSGSVAIGGNSAVTKTMDFTGSGIYPEGFSTAVSQGCELIVPFMEDYDIMCVAHGAWIMQGSALGTTLVTWLTYRKNLYVKLWQYLGPHYYHDAYRLRVLDGPPPSTPVNIENGFDIENPGLATWPYPNNGTAPIRINFTAGSSTVNLRNSSGSSAGAVAIWGGVDTLIASGSRIRLTTTSQTDFTQIANAIPDSFDDDTWYHWKQGGSATEGQLCTDAELTIPVVAGSTKTGVFFWVVPSNGPVTDVDGFGTIDSGTGGDPNGHRVSVKLGTLKMCKAFGMGNDSNGNVDAAIATLQAIHDSQNISPAWRVHPQYYWDSELPP